MKLWLSASLLSGSLAASAIVGAQPAAPVPAPPPDPPPTIDPKQLENIETTLRDLTEQVKAANGQAAAALAQLALLQEEKQKAAQAVATAEAAKLAEERAKEAAQKAKRVPFTGDYTWMNGQSKQKTFPLSTLSTFVVPSIYLDTYYAYSFNEPIDHTLTGTASAARHNELMINLASLGVDWNYENVIGRVLLQWGAMTNVVQDLDATVGRGRGLSVDALRYVREATLGYHFDALHGINLETGIFTSYIGLESYLLAENWNYNRSILCEFTPFYFTGIRAQIYATDNLKIEPWLMNGYQTYGKWNEAPSAGLAFRWNPKEWLALIANFYVGTDTRNDSERVRFHHDHSFLIRAYQAAESWGVSKLAFSVNNHAGFEAGGSAPGLEDAHFLGSAISSRMWFARDLMALSARFELLDHPSGYSSQFPPPGFDPSRGFSMWGLTGTFEVMPTDYLSVRPEFMYRAATEPFFAGRGGTTSVDGFQDTADDAFVPDVRKDQLLFTLGANFRL